jgi:hypothetical protein
VELARRAPHSRGLRLETAVDFIPLRSPPEAEIRGVLAVPSLVDSNVPPSA